MKKAQGLTMNTVVLAALAVIVIAVVVIIFYSFITEGSGGGRDVVKSLDQYCASLDYPNYKCYQSCPGDHKDKTTDREIAYCKIHPDDCTGNTKPFKDCAKDEKCCELIIDRHFD
ncbi:hypothetical protein ACFL1H_00180 [Nanoarchaeota archaeon]